MKTFSLNKMNWNRWIAGFALSTCVVAQAHANISILVGDKDGFGIPGAIAVPPDGSQYVADLHGAFYTDYRDAGDLALAPFTDHWVQALGSPSATYQMDYSLAGQIPVSATLSLQEAGMADNRGPWTVFFNGSQVGQIGVFADPNPALDQTIRLLSWNIPINLLTGHDTVFLSYLDSQGEGYAINFSQLVIVTVPEPSTFGLAGLATVALLTSRGHRGKTTACGPLGN